MRQSILSIICSANSGFITHVALVVGRGYYDDSNEEYQVSYMNIIQQSQELCFIVMLVNQDYTLRSVLQTYYSWRLTIKGLKRTGHTFFHTNTQVQVNNLGHMPCCAAECMQQRCSAESLTIKM